MSLDAFPVKANAPELIEHVCLAVGGASAITKVSGEGIAVSRTDTGDYLLTWSDAPGNFKGATASLQATTIGDLAGHTVVFGAFTAGGTTLAFGVYNAADASHDLAALEWVTVRVAFSHTGL